MAKHDVQNSLVRISAGVLVGVSLLLVVTTATSWFAEHRLLEALRTGSPGAKEGAMLRLGYIDHHAETSRFVSDFSVALSDSDSRVRIAAADGLSDYGAKASHVLPKLIALLKDDDAEVCPTAALAVAMCGVESRDGVAALLDALLGSQGDLRGAIVFGLGHAGLHAKNAVPALKVTVERDRDGMAIRLAAIDSLEQMGVRIEAMIPVLRAALSDLDAEIRSEAARSLGTSGAVASAAIPELIERLTDDVADVRFAAAWALGDIG